MDEGKAVQLVVVIGEEGLQAANVTELDSNFFIVNRKRSINVVVDVTNIVDKVGMVPVPSSRLDLSQIASDGRQRSGGTACSAHKHSHPNVCLSKTARCTLKEKRSIRRRRSEEGHHGTFIDGTSTRVTLALHSLVKKDAPTTQTGRET